MNIAIYCASNIGKNPRFAIKAENLGKWIGKNNHNMVYGGADVGLMSIVANAALSRGAKVIGVMPEFLYKREIAHKGLSQFIKVKTMSERKLKMMELSDCFIALPGGPGTLEEISEIISLVRVNELNKPYFLYNIDGFYDSLIALFKTMLSEGFVTEQEFAQVKQIKSIEELEYYIYSIKN